MSASNPPDEGDHPSDGIIPIDKPAGWTSHDVVARMRRLLRQKRVGHAGTLDPAATGVLPICFGQATRVVEYLSESGKAYRATITFGVETDTYDAEGTIIATHDLPPDLDRAAIEAVLPRFIGDIMQVPPMYSALKRDGQRLYDLARAGVTVDLAPRPVHIASLTIISWSPPDLTLEIECGKGTYIRSLAHDLGAVLGPGAHLKQLVRTRVGPFALARAVSLERLAEALADGSWDRWIYAPDEALLDWRAAILADTNEQRLRHGQMLAFPSITEAARLRAYSVDGRFLGMLERAGEVWKPAKVFSS